jgi:hypothetical protein
MKNDNEIWFWLNTTYACAAIITNESGLIIKTAPIYMKFKDQKIHNVIKYLKKNKNFIDIQALK